MRDIRKPPKWNFSETVDRQHRPPIRWNFSDSRWRLETFQNDCDDSPSTFRRRIEVSVGEVLETSVRRISYVLYGPVGIYFRFDRRSARMLKVWTCTFSCLFMRRIESFDGVGRDSLAVSIVRLEVYDLLYMQGLWKFKLYGAFKKIVHFFE